MPAEFIYFANGLKAAALFTSNIQFDKESGYFDIGQPRRHQPHTWRAGLERRHWAGPSSAISGRFNDAARPVRASVTSPVSCWKCKTHSIPEDTPLK
ncbi:acyltransferase 3 [Rhizobium grahamii CCGE 502]|uniref:Acyltransferase 3 n=1 Tax=Rhizobium grahamii CCGE 502 TaxID=990285 RepID=S3HDT2_9HYPH|nr:acyltransferase 3 [Rhizobium grahamii CCGE 502]